MLGWAGGDDRDRDHPNGGCGFGGGKRIAPSIDEGASWSRSLLGRLCQVGEQRDEEMTAATRNSPLVAT